jgi:hypothetical protein
MRFSSLAQWSIVMELELDIRDVLNIVYPKQIIVRNTSILPIVICSN